jgi:hypothetical protein
MIKVALWCVQYRPELRPMMSDVVKMLEGALEVPKTFNPFQFLMDGTNFASHSVHVTNTYTTTSDSNIVCATPIVKKYEIELASSIA